MKVASGDQSRELIARFSTDTKWGSIEHDPLQQNVIALSREELGRRFTVFLNNGCRLTIKGTSVLVIDRSKPFDPVRFLGQGSRIWRGPIDGGGLEGDEDQDPRSLGLTEIDFSKVGFGHFLKEGETRITGEEKLDRMKADPRIRLDAGVGQALLDEKGQVTLRFLYDTHGISWMEFATALRSSGGRRYFLCLYRRRGGGSWCWGCGWLVLGRYRANVSPLLAI